MHSEGWKRIWYSSIMHASNTNQQPHMSLSSTSQKWFKSGLTTPIHSLPSPPKTNNEKLTMHFPQTSLELVMLTRVPSPPHASLLINKYYIICHVFFVLVGGPVLSQWTLVIFALVGGSVLSYYICILLYASFSKFFWKNGENRAILDDLRVNKYVSHEPL